MKRIVSEDKKICVKKLTWFLMWGLTSSQNIFYYVTNYFLQCDQLNRNRSQTDRMIPMTVSYWWFWIVWRSKWLHRKIWRDGDVIVGNAVKTILKKSSFCRCHCLGPFNRIHFLILSQCSVDSVRTVGPVSESDITERHNERQFGNVTDKIKLVTKMMSMTDAKNKIKRILTS